MKLIIECYGDVSHLHSSDTADPDSVSKTPSWKAGALIKEGEKING